MRFYSNTAANTTVANGAGITSFGTSLILASQVGMPTSFPFVLRLAENTASEELVLVTSGAGTVGSPFIITRGFGGTSAASHAINTDVTHCICAEDLQETQYYMRRAHLDVMTHFGAVGDGVTDDSAAINAALAAATAGSIVFLPPGVFAIDAPLLINNPGVTLAGANKNTSVLKRKSDSCNYMVYVKAPHVTIENIGFNCNEAGLPADSTNRFGVLTDQGSFPCDYITIQGCRFTNTRGFAIYWFWTISGDHKPSYGRVLNNEIETLTGTGGRDICVPVGKYTQIAGNLIIGKMNEQLGLQIYESDHVQVHDNIIDMSAVPDITTCASIQSSYGVDFHDNWLRPDTAGTALSCIIEADNGGSARQFNSHLNIHNNFFQGATSTCITMSNTTYVLCHDNHTDSATYFLLVAGANNQHWKVYDNNLTWVTTPVSGTLGAGSYLRGGNGGYGAS